MTCTHPIRLGEGFIVPCGKCMACRVKRTQEWATRILHEASYYKANTFLTLTYSDDYLPDDGSLSIEEVQLYVKRLRARMNGREIKYYAAGEYGDENKRPHYHLIVMNVGMKKDFDVMDKSLVERIYLCEPVTPKLLSMLRLMFKKEVVRAKGPGEIWR